MQLLVIAIQELKPSIRVSFLGTYSVHSKNQNTLYPSRKSDFHLIVENNFSFALVLHCYVL